MSTRIVTGAALFFFGALASCSRTDGATTGGTPSQLPKMTLTSPAITGEDQPIATVYACTDEEHLGKSPPIVWSGAPKDAVEYAITMIDVDAKNFHHWGLFKIPTTTTDLPAGASPGGPLPKGAVEVLNDYDKKGYGAPCPPPGKEHHYVLTIWALRASVDPGPKLDDALMKKVSDAALASGSLRFTYKR